MCSMLYTFFYRKRNLIIASSVLIVLGIIGIILAVVLSKGEDNVVPPVYSDGLGYYESQSRLGTFREAAVATDAYPCAQFGR